jgi:hypothetical protein
MKVHQSCGLLSPLLLAKLANGPTPHKRTAFLPMRSSIAKAPIDRR